MVARIVVADAESMVRYGIRRLLERERQMDLVALVDSGESAGASVKELRPDVLVAGSNFRDCNVLDLVENVKRSHPDLRVIVYLNCISSPFLHALLSHGVAGVACTQDGEQAIRTAIKVVAAGDSYFSERVQRLLGGALNCRRRTGGTVALTQREREVLVLLSKELTVKEIATTLDRGRRTVESHVENIREKLGAQTIVGAIMSGLREGFISLSER